jgi:hypothetical protein
MHIPEPDNRQAADTKQMRSAGLFSLVLIKVTVGDSKQCGLLGERRATFVAKVLDDQPQPLINGQLFQDALPPQRIGDEC